MSRYRNTKVSRKKNNIVAFDTTTYTKVPERNDDIFVVTQEGDRLDNLAYRFYQDPMLWWFIARVNNLKTMHIPAGLSLRIPVTTQKATTDD